MIGALVAIVGILALIAWLTYVYFSETADRAPLKEETTGEKSDRLANDSLDTEKMTGELTPCSKIPGAFCKFPGHN